MPKINPPFKIFVSAPSDFWLNPNQKSIKHKILNMLEVDGFEVELMGEIGMPYTQEKMWELDRVKKIMQCCQGIIVIGLPRWYEGIALIGGERSQPAGYPANLITEYSHVEGALGFAHHLPMLLLLEDGIEARGILHPSKTLVGIPQNSTDVDLEHNNNFLKQYSKWSQEVKERYHLFFGYSGGAADTAKLILKFLRSKGIRVRDWKDFQTTGTILQQIEQADKTCSGGLFLFTKDDILTLQTGQTQEVPRDNVIFEAGYFINSKGDTHVQIIREENTKLLADLGGQIYLPLKDRQDITSIKTDLLNFVRDRLFKVS